MRSTGVVRRIDELGRIVLPMELRNVYDIKERDQIEIFTNEEGIVLRKFANSCTFCTETDGLTAFHGKPICRKCMEELSQK